jgi:hypothetical protein
METHLSQESQSVSAYALVYLFFSINRRQLCEYRVLEMVDWADLIRCRGKHRTVCTNPATKLALGTGSGLDFFDCTSPPWRGTVARLFLSFPAPRPTPRCHVHRINLNLPFERKSTQFGQIPFLGCDPLGGLYSLYRPYTPTIRRSVVFDWPLCDTI